MEEKNITIPTPKKRTNRLNLNFNLSYIDERKDFVEAYLQTP